MRSLYPKITPNYSFHLDVGDEHEIYVEEVGNAKGKPVLFLHGGPGTGCNEDARRFFDPDMYRVILFDQRGCGRSKPFGSIEDNDTQKLIEDIEAIRQHLKIDKWAVFGGSWGSTLGLLYAISNADKVTGMILRGIYLARKKDQNWLFSEGGISELFPDYFEQFIAPIKNYDADRGIAEQYYELIHSDNDFVRKNAVLQWSRWESHFASLDLFGKEIELDKRLIAARSAISNHFIRHRCFVEENTILDNIDSLSQIPITIVHGRLDLICRIEQAFILARSLGNAQLQVVPNAGHSMFDQFMVDALIKASDDMANFLTETKT